MNMDSKQVSPIKPSNHRKMNAQFSEDTKKMVNDKGFAILSHQYSAVSDQVKAGLYVLRRLVFYLRKQCLTMESQVSKRAEVAQHEKKTKHQQLDEDLIKPVVSALRSMHENDIETAKGYSKFVKDIQDQILEPLMSHYQISEERRSKIDETRTMLVMELAKANDQYESDQSSCSNALQELRDLQTKALEKGMVSITDLKNAISEESDPKLICEGSELCIKEGWLQKTGQYNKNFKKRYFRLIECSSSYRLDYHKNKKDKKPQGSIPLEGTMIKIDISKPTHLNIITNVRTYVIKADTEQLCQQWVNTLLQFRTVLCKSTILQLLQTKEKLFKLFLKVEVSQKEAERRQMEYSLVELPKLLKELQEIEEKRIEEMKKYMLRYQQLNTAFLEEELASIKQWGSQISPLNTRELTQACISNWVRAYGLPPVVQRKKELAFRSQDFIGDKWMGKIGLGIRAVSQVSEGDENVTSPKSETKALSGPLEAKQKENEEWYRALKDYQPSSADGLGFRYDDVVIVTQKKKVDQHHKTSSKEFARCKHDFEGNESNNELGFKKGDAVLVLGKEDKTAIQDWWLGELKGKQGLIPSNYVQTYENAVPRSARAKVDYAATKDSELSVKKGEILAVQEKDTTWTMAKSGDRIGLVPTAFIETIEEPLTELDSDIRLWKGYLAGHPHKIGTFPAHYLQSVREKATDYGSDDEEDEEAKEGLGLSTVKPHRKRSLFTGAGPIDLIRAKVSKQKRRFQSKQFDLDLTYIEHNIIAMGFPSEGIESKYRNSMKDVQRFFESRHQGTYWIYNLCSERHYDPMKFNNNVSEHPFDDHNPCPFDLIEVLVKEASKWLALDENNVISIHCKAGKGRTGFMISCFLLATNDWFDADKALKFFAVKRTKNCEGVTIPSQNRYVRYYGLYKQQEKLGLSIKKENHLKLMSIRIDTLPKILKTGVTDKNVDMWFEIQSDFERKEGKLHPRVTYSSRGQCNCDVRRGMDYILFSHGLQGICSLNNDIRVEFFYLAPKSLTKKPQKLFHFWFNTRFLEPERGGGAYSANETRYSLLFTKSEIDEARKDKRHKLYSSGLQIELTFLQV